METEFAMLLLPYESRFGVRSFEFAMEVCGFEVWTNEVVSLKVLMLKEDDI